MTKFEMNQKNVVFVLAGKKAYHMGINFQDNPYSGQFKVLWQKGWMSESRKYKKVKYQKRVRFS
jgi:hypothetical protein